MLDDFKSLFKLAEIGQSRTSITNPLQWTLVIIVIAIIAVSFLHVPAWFLSALIICFLIVVAIFVYAYVFSLHSNPDVLRSENFHLSKMAIERGLIGDSLHGMIDSEDLKPNPKLIADGSEEGANGE